MAAYGNIDQAIAGQLYGNRIDNIVDGGFACADSNDIEFGVPVFGYVGEEKSVYNYYNDTSKLAFDADFVTSNTIDITVNGVAADQVTFTTDHDTTAGLVVAAVAALTGVECVLDSNDAANRTFIIRTKGAGITVTEDVQAGASQATGTITYASGQIYLGVSVFAQNVAGKYEQYDPIAVLMQGNITVIPTQAVEAQAKAYVDNATTDLGLFTDSANGIEVNARYREDAAADGFARLEQVGKTAMTYAEDYF